MRTRRQGLAAKLPIYRLTPRELTEGSMNSRHAHLGCEVMGPREWLTSFGFLPVVRS
jgi:hypothetical protein